MQRSDIDIKVERYAPMPVPVIADGEIDRQNLERLGLDERWLKKTLSERGISDKKGVLYMTVDENKKAFIIKRDRRGRKNDEGA